MTTFEKYNQHHRQDLDMPRNHTPGHYYNNTHPPRPRRYSNDNFVDASNQNNYKQRASPLAGHPASKSRGPKPLNYQTGYGPIHHPPSTQYLPDDRKCIYVKKNEFGTGCYSGKEEPERLSAYSTNSSDEDAQTKTRRTCKDYAIYYNGEVISSDLPSNSLNNYRGNNYYGREKGVTVKYTRKNFGASEFKQEPETLDDIPVPSFAQ
jgi:hypothetical protein